MHELRLCGHDGVHLRLVPKVIPFVFARGSKDVILLNIHRKVILALIRIVGSRLVLLVLLTSSRLRLRESRELLSVMLQHSHEAALTRGVGRFLPGVLWNLYGWSTLASRVYLPSLHP
jgi:hypothetical protein